MKRKLLVLLLITGSLFAQTFEQRYGLLQPPSIFKRLGTTISTVGTTDNVGLYTLALGGATIGTNALAVTGTVGIGGNASILGTLSVTGNTTLPVTTATSLALGGATIGTNALAVTGTVGIGNNAGVSLSVLDVVKISSASFTNGRLVFGNGNSATIEQVGIFRGALDGTYTGGNYLNLDGYEGINLNTGYVNTMGGKTPRLLISNNGAVSIPISLAIGGATIGANALAVSGTSLFGGGVAILKATNPDLEIRNTSNADDSYAYLTLGTAIYNRVQFRVRAVGTDDGRMSLYTFKNASAVLVQTWDEDANTTIAGNVFIGYTADPTSGNKLAVNGNIYGSGTATFAGNISLSTTSSTLGYTDAFFSRDAAGVFAQKNGVNNQLYRLYDEDNTGSNDRYLELGWLTDSSAVFRQAISGTKTSRPLNFTTFSSYSFDQNVGIGTALPQSKLHVIGSITSGIYVGEDDNLNVLRLAYDNDNNRGEIQSFSSGGASTMNLNPYGGNVGIATNNPLATFHDNGTAMFGSGTGASLTDSSFVINYTSGSPVANWYGTDGDTWNLGINMSDHAVFSGATLYSFDNGITLADAGTSANSYAITLTADNATTPQYGSIQVMYGADPYLRISAPNDAGTATAIMDLKDQRVVIGSSAAGVDYDIYMQGETNQGTITYMEDEDRFDFDNDVKVTADLFSGSYNISALQTPPATAASTGTTGTIIFGTDGYLYLCTATDTWVRVQLTTW